MKRGPVLGAALLATLALTAWLATQEEGEESGAGPVEAAAPRRAVASVPPRPPRAGAVAVPTWPAPPSPRAATPWPFEAAQAQAWVPPAPPAAPTPPPQAAARAASAGPPQAPPFPYPLIGRIEDGATVHALFGAPQRTLGVKVQEVIDGQWRVEAIGAAGVTLTWLPGGVRQTLAFRPS